MLRALTSFSAVLACWIALTSVAAFAQPNNDEDRCRNLPGVWEWVVNGNVNFFRDGRLRQGSLTGSWACNGRHTVIAWSHGYTDRLEMSEDGNYMSGLNNAGGRIWGRRIGNE